jgi:hypothetical protein
MNGGVLLRTMDGEHIILTLTAKLIPRGQHSLTTLNAYKQYGSGWLS